MIESWLQFSCDGCGATDFSVAPNETRKELRDYLRDGGWRHYGRFDYCSDCVADGKARRRESIFEDVNHD